MGGKQRMAPWIHSFIPKGIETYVEVFGGAFWVYMKSDVDNPLATKQHIYNDVNPYMVNLYRCASNPKQFDNKEDFKNIKAVISYADPRQNHTGKIYQAMNWNYIGKTTYASHFEKNGKFYHSRTVNQARRDDKNYDLSQFKRIKTWKYKYVYLYDKSLFNIIKDKIEKYPA